MKMNKIVIIPLLVLVVLVIGTSYAFYTKSEDTERKITVSSGNKYIGIYGDNKENIELNKEYSFTIENRGIVNTGYEVYIESETSINLSNISYTVTGDYSKTGNLSDNVIVYSALASGDSKTLNIKLTGTGEYSGKIKLRYKDYIVNYDYTGGEQTFVTPTSGYYKIEAWGAQGGSVNLTEALNGGYGGYSVGTINQNKNTTLYIYVGGQGIGATKSGVSLDGGYNGGGNVNGSTTVNHITASGGGATHIALVSGLLSTLESYKGSLDSSNSYYISEKIILVAGGGGGARDQANHIEAARWGSGGSGGGFKSSGTFSNNGTLTVSQVNTCLATQTTGNTFGQGATGKTQSGGGGGYFGGYSGNTDCGTYLGSGSGGSGYIANNSLINKHMTCYKCVSSSTVATKTDTTNNYSANPVSDSAKVGNGYAKITYINE